MTHIPNTHYTEEELRRIASVYVACGKSISRTLRQVDRDFPSLKRSTLSNWLARNYRGFNQMVAEAQAQASADPIRWVVRQIAEAQSRLDYLQSQWRLKLASTDDQSRASALLLLPRIQKEQRGLVELHKLLAMLRTPRTAEVAKVAVQSFVMRLVHAATPQEHSALQSLFLKARGHQ